MFKVILVVGNSTLRMPKYAKLQNLQIKRNDTKQRHLIVAIANSPFVLWFLTVVVAGAAGSYFTAAQSCYRESTKIIELDEQVQADIFYRMEILKALTSTAKTPEELKKVYTVNATSLLKEHTLASLIITQYRILENAAFPDSSITLLRALLDADDPISLFHFGRLPETQEEYELLRRMIQESRIYNLPKYRLRSNCGFTTISKILTGAEVYYVRTIDPATYFKGRTNLSP